MSIIFDTPHGPLEVSDAVVQAASENARRHAALTAIALTNSGLYQPNEPIRLPPNFLLELAAVLQLGVWEREGLRAHIDAGLPSAREASATLAERATRGPAEFVGVNATLLSRQVVRFSLERIAWDGVSLLGREVLIAETDEDLLAETLAEFLWNHRRELTTLISDREVES